LGVYGYDVFYNKTNYELAYTIVEENDKTVVVILAGTRENFYRGIETVYKKDLIMPPATVFFSKSGSIKTFLHFVNL
jgi:hypothetical protein